MTQVWLVPMALVVPLNLAPHSRRQLRNTGGVGRGEKGREGWQWRITTGMLVEL